MAVQKQDDQFEYTYSSYVRTQDVTLKTCQRRWIIGRSGERGSGISVLTARHYDIYIYIYIYIYMCVCVCVCVCVMSPKNCNLTENCRSNDKCNSNIVCILIINCSRSNNNNSNNNNNNNNNSYNNVNNNLQNLLNIKQSHKIHHPIYLRSAWIWHKVSFKRSFTGLNSGFSFS